MKLASQGGLFRLDCHPCASGNSLAGTTPAATVIYAIGDIHGRHDLLDRIRQGISLDAARRTDKRKQVVLLGDYFSRGPDSRRVLETIRTWHLNAGDSMEIIALKGNHEDLALRYLNGDLAAGAHWFDYDGLDALHDYGVRPTDRQARDNDSLEDARRQFASALPPEYRAFLSSLRVSHQAGSYYFVHAGVRPGISLAAQTDHDRMWIRQSFLESDLNHGAIVVHGHSIADQPIVRPNRIGIDTGAYASHILTCLVLDSDERFFLQTR